MSRGTPIDFGFYGEIDMIKSLPAFGRLVPTSAGDVQIYNWAGDQIGWNIYFPTDTNRNGVVTKNTQCTDPLTVKLLVQNYINELENPTP
jgi:hypothetical protein